MRLPISNDNQSRTVNAAYCSHFGQSEFCSHPFGSLGTTYDVRLVFIEKCLLVEIELFSLDATGEALRAKIDRKLSRPFSERFVGLSAVTFPGKTANIEVKVDFNAQFSLDKFTS